MTARPQRIRDPLHNLIEFDIGADQFEHTIWQVIQTPPFQRLRRIRQLGFSEMVFPGATHTRFAHSIGVFHIARRLMQVIQRSATAGGHRVREHQAQVALAASLVHDVGHGMFSHAFEAVGRDLGIAMAEHETVSGLVIRQSEIAEELKELGPGFADEVAAVVGAKGPGNLYDAVVSSQFDADRLDYMQRDRLMTGIQSSAVDLSWLLANLEIASVPTGADDSRAGSVDTLVLGPKAFQTAESYVLSLFHLYPNVYLHKTTRGIEQVFRALMVKLIRLARDGHGAKSGLSERHPILRFAMDTERVEHALGLDDQVFWGALPMLADAEDREIRGLAGRLHDRRLPKCIDIRERVEQALQLPSGAGFKQRARRAGRVRLACDNVVTVLAERRAEMPVANRFIFVDEYRRAPYRRFDGSETPLNQILIKRAGGGVSDMAERSPVVAGAETFEVCRAYVFADDGAARDMVENIIRTELEDTDHGHT